jgi:hypothetical protein
LTLPKSQSNRQRARQSKATEPNGQPKSLLTTNPFSQSLKANAERSDARVVALKALNSSLSALTATIPKSHALKQTDGTALKFVATASKPYGLMK